ncbi:MAG TPA: TIGR02452 family protein [Tepidisphaeraceae bacterium]|jgi:uncharacterized protein (TIGR02452 family)
MDGSSQISRDRAAALGAETLGILRAGFYSSSDGSRVDLAVGLRRAAQGTASYPPDAAPPPFVAVGRATRVTVENRTTLAVARELADAGLRPAALNFASARHPGGGFFSGARAQEESLARSSGLYACLEGNPMYAYHEKRRDPLYSNYAIYSPDVPVFREDAGALLDRPYACSVVTSPAVNAKVALERTPHAGPAIREAMQARVRKVLSVMAGHGHDTIILGAWGCGAFGNDPREIAPVFRDALDGEFTGVFATVVFAIVDWSDDARFIGPFRQALAGRSP